MPKVKLPFTWPFDQSKYVAVDEEGNKYDGIKLLEVDNSFLYYNGPSDKIYYWNKNGDFNYPYKHAYDLHLEPIEPIDDFDPLEWMENKIKVKQFSDNHPYSEGYNEALSDVLDLITTAREMRDKHK